ncbi:MAG: cytochrome c oxidase assembly factor Coa1 family protein [Bacteroidota bacterium]
MNNELVPQPSWWKRNWKWVVPAGGCLSLILVLVFFIGYLVYGVSNIFSGSEPYEYAFEKINNDEQIVGLLGAPIEKDGMVKGSINWNNGEKKADMEIPITGPKGTGTLYINASGNGDGWIYHEIKVTIKDNEAFDLLEDK